MSVSQHDSFDPYFEWLQIPPSLRPPSHYDLLGLQPFERDVRRIQEQALARYARVHQHQAGRRSDLAVQLLAELVQAREVLCDPQRKAAYDAELSGRTASGSPCPDQETAHSPQAEVARERGEEREPEAVLPTWQAPASLSPQTVRDTDEESAGQSHCLPWRGRHENPADAPALPAAVTRPPKYGTWVGVAASLGLLALALLLFRNRPTHPRQQRERVAQEMQQAEASATFGGGRATDTDDTDTAGSGRGPHPPAKCDGQHGGDGRDDAPSQPSVERGSPTPEPEKGAGTANAVSADADSANTPRGNAPSVRGRQGSDGDTTELSPNLWAQPVSRVWQSADPPQPLRILAGGGSAPTCLAFSNDGTHLAAGTAGGIVHVWQVADGARLLSLDAHAGEVAALAFGPDDKLLASGGALSEFELAGGAGLRFWRLRDGKLDRQIIGLPSLPLAMMFDPRGRELAAPLGDGRVVRWRVANRQRLGERRPGKGEFTCAAFSPDCRLLAASTSDAVYVWRAEDGGLAGSLTLDQAAHRLAFSQDGSMLGVACGEEVVVWQPESGRRQSLPLHGEGRAELRFVPRTKLLLAADGEAIACWDAACWDAPRGVMLGLLSVSDAGRTGGPSPRFQGGEGPPGQLGTPVALAVSPDGGTLACGHARGDVSLWTLPRGGEPALDSGHAAAVTSLAFSADATRLASASRDGTVRLRRLADGAVTQVIRISASEDSPHSIGFDQLEPLLAVGLRSGVEMRRLYEGARNTQRVVDLPDDTSVRSLALSPDGRYVAVAIFEEDDGRVELYVLNGVQARRLWSTESSSATLLAFSSDGRSLAWADEGQLRLYHVADARPQGTIACPPDVRAIAVSPGMRSIAWAERTHVRLYDLALERGLSTIDTKSAPVTALLFGPQGEWLACGGADGSVRLWRPAAPTEGAATP